VNWSIIIGTISRRFSRFDGGERMTQNTVQGAGSVQSDWAVWGVGKIEPAPSEAAEAIEPLAELRTGDVAEVSVLKASYELLERENELLRQRLAIADRQVEVKDTQINDFRAITDSLTRQNQVLLMLAQGVPMERILSGRGQEIEVMPSRASQAGRNVGRPGETTKLDDDVREKIIYRMRELVSAGMTQGRVAQALNEEGMPTLSGLGKWDRKKVSKAIFILKKGLS
jgi:hypothetical protein